MRAVTLLLVAVAVVLSAASSNATEITTPAQLVRVFEETCLRGYPNKAAVFERASKLGFQRRSDTQWQAGGTQSNVVFGLSNGKPMCWVTATGVSTDGLAQSLAASLQTRGAERLRLRAGGRKLEARMTVNGKKVWVTSAQYMASTRFRGAEIMMRAR